MGRNRSRDPLDGATDRRRGRGFAIGFFVALFLLLGGVYAAGYALTSDRVPRAVSVSGVDIGGLRPGEARRRLVEELAPRAERPIVARAGEQTFRVDPETAGLRLDVAETVAQAGGGRDLNPLSMVAVLTGGDDVEPVVHVDPAALDAEVSRLADEVDRKPVEGAVRFSGGRPQPVYPTPGRRLDEAATAAALRQAFLDEQQTVELPVETIAPSVTDRRVDAAIRRFGEPAMSSAVVVKAAGKSARIRPAKLSTSLSMRARDGKLVPRLDGARLLERARSSFAPLTQPPRPATVALRNGSPKVIPGRPGTTLDPRRLARKIVRVLPKTGERARTVRMPTEPVQPGFGVRQARRLRIDEVVSSFTTRFPHSSYRNTNLGRAAEKIDGTVLRPGETFSFNDTVGKRTAKNGFTRGFIIDDGVLVEDFGGGVSQVATTTYNAAFFAGLKDLEHHPHSLYFDRYPMGREATVVWGALDLRFRNDTPHGILIEAWIEPSTPSSEGEMHVRMWSTEHWTIKAGLSEQYDFTEPKVRYNPKDSCVEQSGSPGFEVDVFRYFHRDGERVRTEKHHVRYDAADVVHCRPPPGGRAGSGNG